MRPGLDAIDAVDSILPAGTLSGAPKIRACEIINELENNKRGIYGGAIGYLDFTWIPVLRSALHIRKMARYLSEVVQAS